MRSVVDIPRESCMSRNLEHCYLQTGQLCTAHCHFVAFTCRVPQSCASNTTRRRRFYHWPDNCKMLEQILFVWELLCSQQLASQKTKVDFYSRIWQWNMMECEDFYSWGTDKTRCADCQQWSLALLRPVHYYVFIISNESVSPSKQEKLLLWVHRYFGLSWPGNTQNRA